MIPKASVVKSDSKPVGEAKYFQYETVEEAVEALGVDPVLKRINAQVRTDAMNAIRSLANTKVTKGKLKTMAFERIALDAALLDEFKAAAGEEVRQNEIIVKVMEVIEAELSAAKAKEGEGEDAPAAGDPNEDE